MIRKSLRALALLAVLIGLVSLLHGMYEARTAEKNEVRTWNRNLQIVDQLTETTTSTVLAEVSTTAATPTTTPWEVAVESTMATTSSTTAASTTLPSPPPTLVPNEPFGRLIIDRLMLVAPLLEGDVDADETALLGGVAHRYGEGLPGEGGNVPIGGHRTSHLKPFRHLDLMQVGDEIVVETVLDAWRVRYTYIVREVIPEIPKESLPNFYPHKGGAETLTLYTCTPLHSTSHRIVVIAALVSSERLM